LLVIDTSTNRLYETWYTWPPGHAMPTPSDWPTYPPTNPTSWWAGSGAIFDLNSNALRPAGWTSGDAAGLPIFPGLVRYDEVARGDIAHAIRFTAQRTQRAYVWPARHYASSITDPNVPPMGQRFRLKANFNIAGFSTHNQVILRALKTYGLILADNGSNWFITGTHDDRWDDDELGELKQIAGSNFEAVDISGWLNNPAFNPDSAAVPGGSSNVTPSGTALPSSMAPGQLLIFPNPARWRDPTIRACLSNIGSIKIIICNAVGEIVHKASLPAAPSGYTSNNKPYYDYIWAGKKAEGIYFVLVQAKQGEATTNLRAKLAILAND
jgi:hypothetical protein